jgi:hypothetical protein
MGETKETIMSDQYYDISVRACGFLNRVRRVEPENGTPYLTCTFAALRGQKGERATPTYFDLKIVGEQATPLLTQFKSVINDRSRQVFVSVKLSELFVKPFTRQKGEHKGETGYAVKSRLLVLESLSIDGVVAYRRADDPTNGSRPARPASEPPAGARARVANP